MVLKSFIITAYLFILLGILGTGVGILVYLLTTYFEGKVIPLIGIGIVFNLVWWIVYSDLKRS